MKTIFAFLLLTLTASAAEFPIGPEFLPSYVDRYESKLIVPAGETVTLSTPSDFDAIEVRGTLKIRANLRYINLTVAEGGTLDIGTATDPVLTPITITKKDVPVDTAFDPFQWGHGIQCFGSWSVYGRKLTQTWSLIQPVEKGGTTLTLDYLPVDWQVGDSLLIPDTKQLGTYTFRVPNPIRHESPVTIAAISGNMITLSKPLDFEHHAIKHPRTGEVVARPAVANCTRNIVFRSEGMDRMNRGHIAVIHTGSCDFRYASIIGMGRTTTDAINSTSLDLSHIGTNQIAKYAFHAHHVAHHAGGVNHGGVHVIGTYVDGLGGGKWGIVDHTSPGFHAEENVITGHPGSGLVTEDGNEKEYLFKRNFCHGASGNGLNGKFNMLLGSASGQFAPGAEGAGIWNHSANGRTLENYCINNKVGIQWMYRDHPGKKFVQRIPPVENARNICVSNTNAGIEQWNSPLGLYADDQVCANNANGCVMGNGEGGNIILNNPRFANSKIVRSGEVVQSAWIGSGVHSSAAYTSSVVVRGGFLTGFAEGLNDAVSMEGKETDFRGNVSDIFFNILPNIRAIKHSAIFDSIQWETWKLESENRNEKFLIWESPGPRITLKNHGGKDYYLGTSWQSATHVATRVPYVGLTNQQVLDQHGLTPLGLTYDPAKAVTLPGLTFGVAIPIDVTPEPDPEVWEPATIGPPFNGDATLRVRNGLIEKLKSN
jgi:hypothetical protein